MPRRPNLRPITRRRSHKTQSRRKKSRRDAAPNLPNPRDLPKLVDAERLEFLFPASRLPIRLPTLSHTPKRPPAPPTVSAREGRDTPRRNPNRPSNDRRSPHAQIDSALPRRRAPSLPLTNIRRGRRETARSVAG